MIRKRVALLLLLHFLNKHVNAQSGSVYAGLTVGASIPLGNYASSDISNANSGFANTGALYNLVFAHPINNKNFGVTAMLHRQVNPVDVQDILGVVLNRIPRSDIRVESTPWVIGSLLVGGYGSLPISKNITLDTRAMIGYISAASPEINIEIENGMGQYWAKQSSVVSPSFAFLIGTSFRFDVAKNIFLLTNLDYLQSSVEFSNIEVKSYFGDRASVTNIQNVQTINFSVGIGLKI